MIRLPWFYAALIASTIFFSALSVAIALLGGGRGAGDWVLRSWSRSILRAAGVRLEVRGLENLRTDAARVVVANHQSYFDIWALVAALPVSLRFIAKRELGRIPLLATGMRANGHVFIDRGNPRSARRALQAAGVRMRREGLSLLVFPEGTRSRDGELGPFKRGSFEVALQARVPLLPVAVDGGRRVFPPGTLRMTPGAMILRVGEPISVEPAEPNGEAPDRATLMREARRAISEMLDE